MLTLPTAWYSGISAVDASVGAVDGATNIPEFELAGTWATWTQAMAATERMRRSLISA
jgi:hypothetical protein